MTSREILDEAFAIATGNRKLITNLNVAITGDWYKDNKPTKTEMLYTIAALLDKIGAKHD